MQGPRRFHVRSGNRPGQGVFPVGEKTIGGSDLKSSDSSRGLPIAGEENSQEPIHFSVVLLEMAIRELG